MAWVNQFLLGRPTLEALFDASPNKISIERAQIAAVNRTISGRRKKLVFRTDFPTIKLDSNWFSVADANIMGSLLTVTDTVLSFQPRGGDLQTPLEINYPTSATTVNLQENSATILSAALVAAGGASQITINGVWTSYTIVAGVPTGAGTNYYTGGSYNDASYGITLGTSLASQAAVFCTYSYSGWAVQMEKLPAMFEGGRVDLGSYSGWELVGV